MPRTGISKRFIASAKMSETTFIINMNLLLPKPLMTAPESPKKPLIKLPIIRIPKTATGFSSVIKDLPAISIVCSGKNTIKNPIPNWISVTIETQYEKTGFNSVFRRSADIDATTGCKIGL